MERGRKLEFKVLFELKKQFGIIEQSGMILDGAFLVMGVSPNGITSDRIAVVELKLPTN